MRKSIFNGIFNIIANPLVHLMNISLEQGIVPNELKLVQVIPLFKNGEKMLYKNYRPVSVLPFFSKILERLMSRRVLIFLINTPFYMNINLDFDRIILQLWLQLS